MFGSLDAFSWTSVMEEAFLAGAQPAAVLKYLLDLRSGCRAAFLNLKLMPRHEKASRWFGVVYTILPAAHRISEYH